MFGRHMKWAATTGLLVFATSLNEKMPRQNGARALKGGTARRRFEHGCTWIWLFYVQHQFEGGIGHEKASGNHCALPWKAVHSTSYRLFCVGFPATSVTTMSTIWVPESPITTWRSVTMPFRRCKTRRRSQSWKAFLVFDWNCGMRSGRKWSLFLNNIC